VSDPGVEPSLIRPGAITYLHIPAGDPAASAAFYREVFGWTVHDPGGRRPSFEVPGGGLSGAFMIDHPPTREPGLLPYIYVEDVAATVQRIRAHGGRIATEPFPEGRLTVAVFQDPAGNALGLWHDTDQDG
jgi:predicted enzyme related to lactoylglutathione lyase